MALLEDQEARFRQQEIRIAGTRTAKRFSLLIFGFLVVIIAGVLVFVLRSSSSNTARPGVSQDATKNQDAKQLAALLNQDPEKVIPQTVSTIKENLKENEYALLVVPPDRSTKPGTSLSYQIQIIRGLSATTPIALTVNDLPSSITAALNPSTVETNQAVAELTLTVPDTTQLGYYAFSVRGQAGSLAEAAPASITVTNITATDILASSIKKMESGTKWQAEISWKTDVPANSWVEYTPQDAFIQNRQTYLFTSTNQSSAPSHSLTLYYLEPDTVYHFRIKSIDKRNNIIVSDDAYFVTAPSPS